LDDKSNGFQVEASKLDDVSAISRLLLFSQSLRYTAPASVSA